MVISDFSQVLKSQTPRKLQRRSREARGRESRLRTRLLVPVPEAGACLLPGGVAVWAPAQRDWAGGAAGEAAPRPRLCGRDGRVVSSLLFSRAAPSGASAWRRRLFLQLPGWSGGWPLCERVWGPRGRPPPCGSQPRASPTCLLPMVQSRPVCLSACLCSFQATPLSRFRRTAGRVLRGFGGGKRSGRHLSCSQSGWKHTVSPVLLISRCLHYPLGASSPLVKIRRRPVRMSFSPLPQIRFPLCRTFPTWTLSSFLRHPWFLISVSPSGRPFAVSCNFVCRAFSFNSKNFKICVDSKGDFRSM